MSVELRLTSSEWNAIRRHLLADRYEHAAILICGHARAATRGVLLVHRVLLAAEPDHAVISSELGISLSPTFIAHATKLARELHSTVILCHSHPFPGPVHPSELDLRTERDLCGRALAGRLSPLPVGSLIIGPEGFNGRAWHDSIASPITRVTIVGQRIETLETGARSVLNDDHARQILAWGESGQRNLAASKIAVVGCGGTGSHVALQLAHLGIGDLVLVDHDVVETSNLSRLVGVGPDSLGQPKAEALAALINRASPRTRICVVRSSVLDIDTQILADCDLIVSATDGHGSRAWLTEFAEQYLVCLVDLGVEIQPGERMRAGGGVRVVRPGHGCLQCANTLLPALVREEFLSSDEQEVERRRGYLRGDAAPTPSVIALNGVVASLAVLEICELLTGLLGAGASRLLYRADRRALTTTAIERQEWCYVCGSNGISGLGDGRPMPRRDGAAA
jgi:molybdopterin-synthase adenylyltransferase